MVKLHAAASASSLVIVGESIENFSVGADMVRCPLPAFWLSTYGLSRPLQINVTDQ